MNLVLASASPRRRELLTQAGFTFHVHPAHIPEDPLPNEDPIAYVVRLARQKAEAVFAQVNQPRVGSEKSISPQVVLGADTTVTIDNHILGKPENASRRRPHVAPALRPHPPRHHRRRHVTAARTEVAAEVTGVRFLTLSEEEIAAYIATGEPMDKAGAYAIQGHAARWIPRITGDYFNVVGLPSPWSPPCSNQSRQH